MNCFFLIHSSFNVVNYFSLGFEPKNISFLCPYVRSNSERSII